MIGDWLSRLLTNCLPVAIVPVGESGGVNGAKGKGPNSPSQPAADGPLLCALQVKSFHRAHTLPVGDRHLRVHRLHTTLNKCIYVLLHLDFLSFFSEFMSINSLT